MQGTWPSVDQQFANNLNSPQSGTPTPTVTALNPIPSSTFPSPDPFSTFTWYFDPYLKPGYSMQWNFGIEHQFGTKTLASVNYVGSGSRRQPLSSVYNTALTPGPGNPLSRSQFPYAGIDYFDRSWNRSNYEALQVMVPENSSHRPFLFGFVHLVEDHLHRLRRLVWIRRLLSGGSGPLVAAPQP